MIKKPEIDIKKLRDYCLNPEHPLGKHKAHLFKRYLNFKRSDANLLKEKLLEAVRQTEAEYVFEDEFGVRYKVDVRLNNKNHSALVRTIWILKKDKETISLVTCYVIV